VWIEAVGFERHLAIKQSRIAHTIAPGRQGARDHLVECHRYREALRVEVPAGRLAQAQEGVEVGACPGIDIIGRGAREREIKEHKLLSALCSDLGDADIVRLDIAMNITLVLEVLSNLKQLFSEAADEVQ
jgi:predicted metal-dependent hydrolase